MGTLKVNHLDQVHVIRKDDSVDFISLEGDVHFKGNLTSGNTIQNNILTKNENSCPNIIESFYSICDGTTFELTSLDVQVPGFQNQFLSTTYEDIIGTKITYQPPPECIGVYYEFNFSLGWNDDHCISHWRFYWDGNEFTQWRRSLSGRYMEQIEILDALIFIRGENAYGNSQVADHNWVTPKVMKWQGRDYSDGNEREKVHLTQYWDGGDTDMFHMPRIGITAYRYLPTRNFIPGSPNHNDTKSLNSLGSLGDNGSGNAILH